MRAIRLKEFIHIVAYSCNKFTLCNKTIEIGQTIIEKSTVWEITCPRCKKLVSPYKEYASSR